MLVRFWLSRLGSAEEFVLPIGEDVWRRHNALTSRVPRMVFWHDETGDGRLTGSFTALMVEPV